MKKPPREHEFFKLYAFLKTRLMTTNAANQILRGDCSLEFFNEQILYRARTNGAGEIYKFLSLATVTAAFRNAPVDSGWIPPGVIRCGSTTVGAFAVLFLPANKYK